MPGPAKTGLLGAPHRAVLLEDTTAWSDTALLGFANLVPFPWGDTSTLTRVWLWALLSTTRMNMEICVISTLAAPVRSLEGERLILPGSLHAGPLLRPSWWH